MKIKSSLIALIVIATSSFITVAILATRKHRPNPVYRGSIGKIKNVLILGNSITFSPASASIGWNHNCGMAASTQDSDYVHRLIAYIHAKDPTVQVYFRNIADFERGYWYYDIRTLDTFRHPDMLILRISENVGDGPSLKEHNFIGHYNNLITYFHSPVTVIVTGFWKNRYVNKAMSDYAWSKNFPLIELSDLFDDPTNQALGKYANESIQHHPSDKGMRMISDRIWSYIGIYFKTI